MSNGKKAEVKAAENLPAIVDKFGFLAISDLGDLRDNIGNSHIGPGDLERITVPAGKATTWEIPGLDGEMESLKELVGIPIHWKEIRAFWKDEYTGQGAPPDCKSLDTITGVGIPGGVCAICPNSKFGSGKNNSQACKLQRLIYLMRENQLLPLIVNVPPTSVQPIRKFFLNLLSQGTRYDAIVISLKIEKDKNKGGIEYSKIKPSIVTRLDKETAIKVKAYADKLRSVMEEAAATNPETY